MSLNGKKLKRQTMFFKPRFKKYADIVKMDTPKNAMKATEKLMEEYYYAKTREKKVRVLRVTVLASNRAKAFLQRKNLSDKERKEFKEIYDIYRFTADRMKERLD